MKTMSTEKSQAKLRAFEARQTRGEPAATETTNTNTLSVKAGKSRAGKASARMVV